MSKSDQWVVFTIGLLILLHLSIWAIGYYTGRIALLMSWVNIAAAASIVIYWIVRQMQIEQHVFETREVVVLLSELLVIIAAGCYIANSQRFPWLKTIQYIVFAIHLLVLIVGLIFMLTFKMNKLM